MNQMPACVHNEWETNTVFFLLSQNFPEPVQLCKQDRPSKQLSNCIGLWDNRASGWFCNGWNRMLEQMSQWSGSAWLQQLCPYVLWGKKNKFWLSYLKSILVHRFLACLVSFKKWSSQVGSPWEHMGSAFLCAFHCLPLNSTKAQILSPPLIVDHIQAAHWSHQSSYLPSGGGSCALFYQKGEINDEAALLQQKMWKRLSRASRGQI